MKARILTLILVSFAVITTAQDLSQKPQIIQTLTSEKTVYQLFPTKNFWTFIKLNTRNGKMWQVNFSLSEEEYKGECFLNMIPLVGKDKESNGRFTLYPTENMFNFLLLDQIDGKVFQVQWAFEPENRGVVPIE